MKNNFRVFLQEQVSEGLPVFMDGAIGTMIQASGACGYDIPEDISVVGFDGIDIGRYMNPRLTTIRQHRESIALKSVEILLDRLDEPALAVHEVEPFHLVPGESVCKH